FRLSGEDVAHTIETLMLLAVRTGHKRVHTGPREPALREARVCYDHLAGTRGVQMFDSLLARGLMTRERDAACRTDSGRDFAAQLSIDAKGIEGGKRAGCLACLDWSERRDHLAGRMGAALFARIIELGWARRDISSRAVIFSRHGVREFDAEFST